MWHLVTCEYPPACGGVADHSRTVASGLAAAGGAVHVWSAGTAASTDPRIAVHDTLGAVSSSDLRRTDAALDAHPAPRILVVQWVPHGYGGRGLNVGFAAWLLRRRRRGDRVFLIVHEPFLEFGWRLRLNAGAAIQRLMITLALAAAERVWVTVPAWRPRVRPWALGRNLGFDWLPVPSGVPVVQAAAGARVREAAAGGVPLVGHFGTFGELVTRTLRPALERMLDRTNASVLLIGRGSDEFRARWIAEKPDASARVMATGALAPDALSAHLHACDLLVQPYPDGVSSRRSSTVAALAHGRAVVTNSGKFTEDFWSASGAVLLAESTADGLADAAVRLLADALARHAIEKAAVRVAADVFAPERVSAALHAAALGDPEGARHAAGDRHPVAR